MKTISDPSILALISGGGREGGSNGPDSNQIIAEAGAIGAGTAASRAISAAGSIAALSEGSALAVSAAAYAGVAASAVAGYQAGTFMYQNSQTVRDGSGAVVEALAEMFKELSSLFSNSSNSTQTAGTDEDVIAPPKRK